MLHADTREPKDLIGYQHPGGPKGLLQKTLGDDQVVVRTLESADFVFYDQDGHSLGIERKAGGDFAGSMNKRSRQKNGNLRLLNQLTRMKSEYTHCALLIEGILGYIPDESGVGGLWVCDMVSHWNWLAVQMMFWQWEMDGLKMFYTPTKEATVELLRGLNNRANAGCVLSGMRGKRKK